MAMEGLRHAAKESKFMKLILGGFIFLAVGGLVFTDVTGSFSGATGSRTVASVNGEKIDLQQFDRDLNNALRSMGLTSQEAYQVGLTDAFLQGKIANIVQMQSAEKLDLMISDQMVAQQIQRAFGDMSKEEIQATLRAQGLSEQQFAQSIRANLVSRTMQQMPLAVSNYIPAYMKRADARLQAERRGAVQYTLPLKTFEDKINVTEEDLKAYYQSNIATYTVAEERSFSIGAMTLAQATKNMPKITAEDVKQAYEDNKENFRVNEKRKLSQVTVKDIDQAQAIYEKALAGESLKTALEAVTGGIKGYRKAADYTKSGLASDLATIAFDQATKEGEVTAPVKTALGYTLMEVGKVTPSYIQPFKDVKKDLQASLKEEARYDAVYDKIVAVEDFIDAGKSFDEIASEIGLKIQTTKPYSQENVMLSDNDLVTEILNGNPSVLDELYALPEGNSAYPIELDDQFVVIGIKGIKPQTVLSYDDVKTDIEKIVRQAQLNSFAQSELEELVETLNANDTDSSLDDSIFKTAKKKTFKNLKRSDETVVSGTVFQADKGQYGYVIDGEKVSLVHVTDIQYAAVKPQTEEQIAAIRQAQRQTIDTLLGQYYHDKSSISINESLLERTYGENSSL